MLASAIDRVKHTWLAFLVLGIGLLISVAVWWLVDDRATAEAAGEFRQKTQRAVEVVERQIQDNINLLLGLKGLFAASSEVTRLEFRRYLSGLEPDRRFPGVRVVSYGARVGRGERTAFERRVRADTSIDPRGYPGFAIKPPGERDEYVAIEYFEPFEGNEISLGLDLAANPARRVEIALARDSGEPVASAPFAATFNPHHVSFSVRMAVYRARMPVRTLAERRKAFLGVVAAVIEADELMMSLFAAQLGTEFEIVAHDLGPWSSAREELPGRGNLLYDSRFLGGEETAAAGDPFRHEAMFDVSGRKWRLSFSLPRGVPGVDRTLPRVVFMGGLMMSLLLFWLVWALLVSRGRALKLAQQTVVARAAESLRGQLAFIQQLIETVPQPVFFKDAEGRYLGVNRAWEGFFGISREQFIGKTVFELYPHHPELARKHHEKDQQLFGSPGSQSYEAVIVAGDGTVRHTLYNKATFNHPDGSVAGLIGTIADVTELKDAEAALRKSEGRFRDLTELSSDWYWEQDATLRFTQISSKVQEFRLGSEEDIGKVRWEMSRLHMTPEQWAPHRAVLEARESFHDFVYERYDVHGNLRTISVSGRPIFDENGHFQGYRGTGRDITEQKRTEERIRHMAHHDALTGLPNRVLLQDRIGQAIVQAQRNPRAFALLFIDLDRFKTVNDSLGHQVGDRLLQAVAGRLAGCTRTSDTIARLGGDEFVVVANDLSHPEDARFVAQKIIDAMSEPVTIDAHELKITPSIGICAYPHDGEDVETLMRNADTAMYHAKQMGRNNFQFFTQSMNDAAKRRLSMENELRHAFSRGVFEVHYQPQLDLDSGAIVGFEALIRWPHAQQGQIPPSQFIPVAEETGLINPVGEWVLREACRQLRAWHDDGHAELRVSVNCSAQQFQREGFVAAVGRILDEAGLKPGSLELEITESIVVQHSEEVTARFEALDRMGVRIALDDFGTGYSSLGYLKRLAIHQLKIDQSFVHDVNSDPDDAAIVSAIVAVAHSLDLEVVAEGVETAEQLAFLKVLGCARAQGYYFSRPLPAEACAQLLRDWGPRARKAVGV